VTLGGMATVLRYSYGVTGGQRDGPRRPRAVSSVRSLYPLELFLHSTHVQGLSAGLYHYNPALDSLRLLRRHDHTHQIAAGLIDKHVAQTAAALLFLAALPERMVFRYGERGYRLVLLEAGAVVQNVNLVTQALGLVCVNIGNYYDRKIDSFLGFDGVTISTVYLLGVGNKTAGVEPARALR
jgi:SagB-type dehydrogenase family enzyme